MKPGLPVAFVAVVGSGVALVAFSGRADPVNTPAHMEKHQFSDADRAAFLDAWIAAFHAGLKLTPEQDLARRRIRAPHCWHERHSQVSEIQG
jgi:hypothetical protein